MSQDIIIIGPGGKGKRENGGDSVIELVRRINSGIYCGQETETGTDSFQLGDAAKGKQSKVVM